MKYTSYIALIAVLLLFSCQSPGDEDVVAEITTCELYSDISMPSLWNFQSHQFSDRNLPQWVQSSSEEVLFVAGNSTNNNQAFAQRSLDGGANWSVFPMSFHEEATSFWFQDEGFGFVGLKPSSDQNTRLALTVDAGITWFFSEYDNLEGEIVDLYFENDEEGYALLHSSNSYAPLTLLYTNDAAQSWTPIFTDPTLQLDKTKLRSAITDQYIYLTGAGGNIYKVSKSNQQLMLRQGPETEINQLCVVDDEVFFAVGISGLFVTNDGAATWTRKATGDVRIGAFFNANQGLIVQNQNYCPSNAYHAHDALAGTNDQGDTWVDGDLTSNLIADFSSSQLVDSTHAVFLFGNKLVFCSK